MKDWNIPCRDVPLINYTSVSRSYLLHKCHTSPPPCMHPATHTLSMHTPPAMHASLPHTPLPCKPSTMHTPWPHMPPTATHAPPATYAQPLWTEFFTHAWENITFPQLLLQTVKSYETRSRYRFRSIWRNPLNLDRYIEYENMKDWNVWCRIIVIEWRSDVPMINYTSCQ